MDVIGTKTLTTRSAPGDSESQTKGCIDRLDGEDGGVSLRDQEESEGKEERDQAIWGKGERDQVRLGKGSPA